MNRHYLQLKPFDEWLSMRSLSVRAMSFLPVIMIFWLVIASCRPEYPDLLVENFRNPKSEFKPWVYWYWIDENISKEGITRDLEAMAKAGIGRALIGHVSPGNERGNVRMFTDEWWKMIEHAVDEGFRTGVDIGFFNGPGWSQSGGPWIGAGQAMQHVVNHETFLKGPMRFSKRFSSGDSLYQRISLQAFPVPENRDSSGISRISTDSGIIDIKNLNDKDADTSILFPENLSVDDSFNIEYIFNTSRSIQSISFSFLPVPFRVNVTVYALDESGADKLIREIVIDRRYINFQIGPQRFDPVTFSLQGTTASGVRLVFRNLTGNSGAGLKEITIGSEAVVDQAIEKQLGKMYSGPLPPWDAYMWKPINRPPYEEGIQPDQIVDLTGRIDSTGNVTWEVPAGNWILFESGMVPTGATNVPVPPEATGYECDKLTADAVEKHFQAYIGKILEKIQTESRPAFKTVVIDSYEVGPQNWTSDFSNVFQTRYGYDPVPWLPVLNGRIVKNRDLSNRFLWDVRRLSADLIANKYVSRLRELSHDTGLELWIENYGHWGFPAEFLQYGGQADQVSGEFWFENHLWDLGPLECRAASSAAHTYGKKQIFAEAFTAGFNFRQYPASMKSRGDRMFCEGVNHFVQHVYVHQPWDDRKPGVTTWFGMAYQRHNTWFEQSIAWNRYLQRCHYLLQQGLPVTDICYFIGEDAPKMTGILQPSLPRGYDYDFINADVILNRLTVRDGLLMLPDGKSYRMMVLPPQETMRPELLRKIRELVNSGAVIYGEPPVRSPSMENFPEADEEVKNIALDMWGNRKQGSESEISFGAGKIFSGSKLDHVFQDLVFIPDVVCTDTTINWTHRKSDEVDIYFLANSEEKYKSFEISFRIAGKLPEIWDPSTGIIKKSAVFDISGFRTKVPVELGPSGSLFVVFRQPFDKEHILNVQSRPEGKEQGIKVPRVYFDEDDEHAFFIVSHTGKYILETDHDGPLTIEVDDLPAPVELEGPWELIFPANQGVPERTSFKKLVSWSDHPDPAIRHFSGTAAYFTTFDLPEESYGNGLKHYLDLGEVMIDAEVIVNGRELGILWKKPFRLNITDAIRPGKNEILVRVTNTWWNRLVGNEKYPDGIPGRETGLPPAFTTHKAWDAQSELLPSGLLGPVRISFEKEYRIW